MYINMFINQQCIFCTIHVHVLLKAMIVIPTGEGKDRPSLSPIPVAYVQLLKAYRIKFQKFAAHAHKDALINETFIPT